MTALWHAALPEEKQNIPAAYAGNGGDVADSYNAGYGFSG
jgi:hypothetical protein